MNNFLSLVVTSVILISSQAFAELIVTSPIEMRWKGEDFKGMNRHKLETDSKVTTGRWKCVGEAGYKHFNGYSAVKGSPDKVANCSVENLEFKDGSLKLTKGKKEFTINHVVNYPWIIYSTKNATEHLYNNFMGDVKLKNGKDANFSLYIPEHVQLSGFFLTDCTLLDGKLLVCKTKGGYNDYACDVETLDIKTCTKDYSKNMKERDLWSVFARENDANVYRIISDEVLNEN